MFVSSDVYLSSLRERSGEAIQPVYFRNKLYRLAEPAIGRCFAPTRLAMSVSG
jgi:hypothetical protein